MQVARHLPPRVNLTVITNALNLALELAVKPEIRLITTGGTARRASFELTGPIAGATVKSYHLDAVFVGVNGLDARIGCTTHDEGEAAVNRAMVEQASRVIVVADSTKLGRRSFARICSLSEVTRLITDDALDPALRGGLEDAGLAVREVAAV